MLRTYIQMYVPVCSTHSNLHNVQAYIGISMHIVSRFRFSVVAGVEFGNFGMLYYYYAYIHAYLSKNTTYVRTYFTVP